MSYIKVKHVSRSFRRTKTDQGLWNSFKSLFVRKTELIEAIKDVSLEIPKGKIVGLIGSNGAGKSTLIKMMVGLISPTSGLIEIAGHVPKHKKKEFLKMIGVVLGQKNQLWWDLSPYETYLLNKAIYEIEDAAFEKKVKELSKKLNVEHVLKSPVRTLSLGERMKCELIASLLHSPSVLFLDEPTIGLDFVAQKNIRKFLRDYCVSNQTTVVLTSHYLPDIEELCEDIIILKGGMVYFSGKLKELKSKQLDYKYITITLDEKVSEQELRRWGEVTDIEQQTLTLKVNSDKLNDSIRTLIQTFNVIDYHVKEMTTQDLLEDLFRDNQSVEGEVFEKVF